MSTRAERDRRNRFRPVSNSSVSLPVRTRWETPGSPQPGPLHPGRPAATHLRRRRSRFHPAAGRWRRQAAVVPRRPPAHAASSPERCGCPRRNQTPATAPDTALGPGITRRQHPIRPRAGSRPRAHAQDVRRYLSSLRAAVRINAEVTGHGGANQVLPGRSQRAARGGPEKPERSHPLLGAQDVRKAW